MRRGWQGVLCCWLALACAAAAATTGELSVGAEDSYTLSRSFMVLEDKSARLTLDDILKPEAQAGFRPVAQAGPGANFGLTPSAIWLRIRLRTSADTPADWLLEVAYPPLDRLELYSPGPDAGFLRQLAGDQQPFAERLVAHRNHVLPVRLLPGAQNTLYMRLASEGTVAAPTRLWRPAALWRHDQASYAALSLYFGLLIGLLLYNLLLFVSVKDPAYLIYVAFVASMSIGQAGLTGLGAQFVWPHLAWWNNVAPVVGMTAAAIFGILFTRNFLATAVRMPRMDRVMLAQLAGWALALLAALTLGYGVAMWMVIVLAVLTTATIVSVGVTSIRRGFAGAYYFVTAWTLLLLGVVTQDLHSAGVFASNVLTSNALLIGSGLEMVLLSFALADRINVARRFKEQAQMRIAAEHAMVQALSQAQERLKTVLQEREIILDNSIVGIAFLTPEGRLRWANRAMMDIFGARGRRVTTMEPFYLSREQYLDVGGEVAAHAARGEAYQRELMVQRYDGTRIWILLSGKAVSRDDLKQGTVWVIMDVTQRKQLETQLHKTSSEREAILDSALVGIVLSVAGRHEWVNEKFAAMLGCPREQLIGRPSGDVLADEDAQGCFQEQARAALVDTGSYVCERQLKRCDGRLLWVEMGGSCIRAHDPDAGVIWTFLDITERKKSESEIRGALERQKALNELRSRFAAMASHEFRTPLAAILSAGELLRRHGDQLPQAERIEILDGIADSVQRMTRMIDRVLLLGKADAGMLDFAPRRIDTASLCRQLVEEARAHQTGDRREVLLEVGEGVEEGLYDEKLLRHILLNLLTNALKYSPAQAPVRFTVRREHACTVFEVADQGIGIPANDIAHLFESFHRASNADAIQGTGLGLAIVKHAVERHGGSIEVASTVGQGSVFKVTLPS